MKNLLIIFVATLVSLIAVSQSTDLNNLNQRKCRRRKCCYYRPGLYVTPRDKANKTYLRNLRQRCRVYAPPGFVVQFEVTDFDTEHYDVLRILDRFRNRDDNTVTSYSRKLGNFTHVSRSSEAWFRFYSDESFQRRGFEIHISFLDTRTYCDVTFLSNLYDGSNVTCSNQSDYRATSCVVSLNNNSVTKRCEDGEWIIRGAHLNQAVLQLCETPRSVCPFTAGDLIYHYTTTPNLPPLTPQEELEIDGLLDAPSTLNLLGKSTNSCRRLCNYNTKTNTYAISCSKIRSKARQVLRLGNSDRFRKLNNLADLCVTCQQSKCHLTSFFSISA